MLDRLARLAARLPEPLRARARGAVRGAPSLGATSSADAAADDETQMHSDRLTEQDIWAAYRLFMGREPDDAGLEFFRARIGDWGPDAVLPYFAHSEEFRSSATYRVLLGGSGDDGHEVVDHRGHRLVVPLGDDAIGGVLRSSGTYEPHVMAALDRVLEPGMTVIDGGANIGIVTMAAAQLVGPTGAVVAVEALARNAALVRLSAALNGWTHVSVHHAALDRGNGLRVIDTAAGSNGIVAGTVRRLLDDGVPADELAAREVVETSTLDELGAPLDRVDLLKLDIEGAEGLALAGGRGLVERHRPTILLEYSPDLLEQVSGVDGPTMLRELVDDGYRLEVLDEHTDTSDTVETAPEELGRLLAGSGHDHLDLLLIPNS